MCVGRTDVTASFVLSATLALDAQTILCTDGSTRSQKKSKLMVTGKSMGTEQKQIRLPNVTIWPQTLPLGSLLTSYLECCRQIELLFII